MEVKTITISRAAKMNLGNYESVDQFVSMTVELQEGDQPKASAAKLAKVVEQAICEQLYNSMQARGKKSMTRAKVASHYGLEESKPITKAPPKKP